MFGRKLYWVVLGELATRSAYGRDLPDRIARHSFGTRSASVGAVQRALERLEDDGMIQRIGQSEDRGDVSWLWFRTTEKGKTALAARVAALDRPLKRLFLHP